LGALRQQTVTYAVWFHVRPAACIFSAAAVLYCVSKAKQRCEYHYSKVIAAKSFQQDTSTT
jgi:hypothetical protein